MKVYYTKKAKVVGATIVAPRAGEVLQEFIIALENGITISSLATAIHVYPTYSAGVVNIFSFIVKKWYLEGFFGKMLKFLTKINR